MIDKLDSLLFDDIPSAMQTFEYFRSAYGIELSGNMQEDRVIILDFLASNEDIAVFEYTAILGEMGGII